jgi:2-dehydropantoate 2-reductase
MKIAVMGAGGMGGYVGGRLAQVGEDVHFVARGAHLMALRETGLRIESPYGDAHVARVAATDDPSTVGTVDVVLFTVKLFDTEAAAARLAPLIGERTRVVTLQNGIDSRALLARHVAAKRIAAGCIYVSAAIAAPGVIRSPGGPQRMVVDGLGGDLAIAALVAACSRAPGLEASTTDTITTSIWEKFVTLAAFSGATCLSRRPVGDVLGHRETRDFLKQLLEENVAVAGAVGETFAPGTPERILGFFGTLACGTKSSMLLDLEASRPLELPWLAGRIVELGQRHGVPVPANAAVLAALAPHVRGTAARQSQGPQPAAA